jgi:hypothetical protein
MPKSRSLLMFLLLVGAAGLLSCGGGMSNTRLLQSIMVMPTAADAQTFPGGMVQFTATGSFSMPPTPARVMNATWCISDANGCMANAGATVDANGMAQCNPGFMGMVMVKAMASNGAGSPPVMMMGPTGVMLSGTAQLTCP